MFSISDLIPTWVKVAAVAVVIAGVGIAIYQWRADIISGAYDHIFKQQVDAQIKQQDDRFKELLAAQQSKTEELQKQVDHQKQIETDLSLLRQKFDAQHFQNNAIDPGLKFEFDQLRARENARTAKPVTTQGGTTLEQWKRAHP